MTQFKNNLEAVKRTRIEFEKELEDDENNQWLKDIIEEFKETEKSLEVLKIFKKYCAYDGWHNGLHLKAWEMNEKELTKIRDWWLDGK